MTQPLNVRGDPALAGALSKRVRIRARADRSLAFNSRLLRRFINLMGLFPVRTLVRLNTEEVALVTDEHPTDPFGPQVTLLLDPAGARIEEPSLVNPWEPDDRGEFPRAVVEAVDPDAVQIDPLAYL